MVVKIFKVAQKGRGKPDYSRSISAGEVRPGLTLKQDQTLVRFDATRMALPSPFAWVRGALAPGETCHFVDSQTGIDLPYTIPRGYTLTFISGKLSCSQDCRVLVLFDTYPMDILGYLSGGQWEYEADIAKLSSALFDATAKIEHTGDFKLTNLGGEDLEGGATFFAILETAGTSPIPKTKRVQCKFCQNEWEVPRDTTFINCPQCGELNIYLSLSKSDHQP